MSYVKLYAFLLHNKSLVNACSHQTYDFFFSFDCLTMVDEIAKNHRGRFVEYEDSTAAVRAVQCVRTLA